MGSGLILLVIVGAWLAVLVPMGLRSHDGAGSARSPERLAARVLPRRSAVAPDEDVPARPKPRSVPVVWRGVRAVSAVRVAGPAGLPARLGQPVVHSVGLVLSRVAALRPRWRAGGPHLRADRWASPPAKRAGTPARRTLSPAVRRRRVLLGLVAVCVLSLVAGLAGPGWLRLVAGATGVLAVLFLVHCRRQAVARAGAVHRVARQAVRQRHRPVAVAHEEVATAAEVVTAPVAAEPVAGGSEWQPVPVPLPTYVGKPAAPRRVVADPEPAADTWDEDDRDELGAVLERRRVVGGW